MMSLKRLWWWRLRARSHLRPAFLMTSCFMAFLLLLNRAVVVDRAAPHGLPNIFVPSGQDSPPLPPPPPPLPPQPPPLVYSPPSSSAATVTLLHPNRSPSSASPLHSQLADRKEVRPLETADGIGKAFTSPEGRNQITDYFDTYKGKVVNLNDNGRQSTNINSRNKDDTRNLRRNHHASLASTKGDKTDPSFGFVNDNFQKQSRSAAEGNGFVDVLKGFMKGERAVNPGTLLGVVAALKNVQSSKDAEGTPLKSVLDFAQAVRQSIFVEPKKKEVEEEEEKGLPDSQDFLKQQFRSKDSDEESISEIKNKGNTSMGETDMSPNETTKLRKDRSLNEKKISKPSNKPSAFRAFNPTNIKGALGAMASLFDQGLSGRSSGQSVLSSVLTHIAPPLLAKTFSQGKNDGVPSSDTSSPLQSLVSGVGPVLLAGLMQQGFGKGNLNSKSSRNSTKPSPFQSFLSDMGPSLLAGALQAGLGVEESDKKSRNDGNKPSPVQSVLSGLGSVLMAGVAQGGMNWLQKSNGGPVELGRARSVPKVASPALAGRGSKQEPNDGKTGSKNTSYDEKSRSLGPLHDGKEKLELAETIQRGRGGVQARDSNSLEPEALLTNMAPPPPPLAGAMTRTLKTQQPKDEDFLAGPRASNTSYSAREEEAQEVPHDVIIDKGKGELVRQLTRTILEGVLPEEVAVPEPNSTRGAWDMAVNLVFGNPRDGEGKSSQFWKWLREHGGGVAEEGADHTSGWITQVLDHSPQRSSYNSEITRLYDLLEGQQSICTNVKYVGGVFNWKTDVLDGARAVCMDADISPKRRGCVVYSFGIKEQWDFEEEMEKMGCEVWAFDPAVRLGNHNHTSHIHFYSLGLASSNTTRIVDDQVWNLFTLSAVMGKLGHNTTPIDYLKLDIHGDEWEVLQEAMQDSSRHALTNVRQLGVEVHLHRALYDPTLYKYYLDTLLGLESFGFQLFSSNMSQKQEKRYEDPVLKRRVSLDYNLVYLRI
ncbi:uncharacterized protein [Panulirus ornatus]|uniref:uncharacterized protein n=1 Tax=Panulirus ornatus TaxID=150431 RepID=UPI003A87E7D1